MVPHQNDPQLFASLLNLADALTTGFDVVDLADRLVISCLQLLPVQSASILLDDRRGSLRVLASSSEEAHVLELLEVQSREGPCLQAIATGEAVGIDHISSILRTWPKFFAEARAQGVVAAYALPMRLRDRTVGALNLFCEEPAGLGPADLRVAQTLTTMATIGLLSHRALQEQEVLTRQLQTALDSRVVIEQAKGVIAERAGISMSEAFAVLRRAARSHRRPLSDLAAEITRGDLPGMVPAVNGSHREQATGQT